jgi:hypothetical protein
MKQILLAAAVLLAPLSALAAPTISTSIVGTPTYGIGTNFVTRVAVSANPDSFVFGSAAIRVTYDTSDVTFVSATGDSIDGWLGVTNSNTIGGEEVVSGTVVSRDIVTIGNFANTVLLPNILDVEFTVAASVTPPFDIAVSLDPGVSAGRNSLVTTAFVGAGLGTTYDNTATSGLTTVDDWTMLAE